MTDYFELLKRGDISFFGEKYNEAIKYYKEAINLDSTIHHPLYSLYLINYFHLRNFDEAFTYLKAVLELKPDYSHDYWCKMGEILLKLKKRDKAFFSFIKSFEMKPTKLVAKKIVEINELGIKPKNPLDIQVEISDVQLDDAIYWTKSHDFTLKEDPTGFYNYPEIILQYLVILPKSIAENPILLEKVAEKRPEISSLCFHKLFSVDITQLKYEDFNGSLNSKNSKVGQVWLGDRTNDIFDTYSKIIFDNYLMIEEIAKTHSNYFPDTDQYLESYRFADLRNTFNCLNNLENYQKKLKSGKFFLMFNVFRKEIEPHLHKHFDTENLSLNINYNEEFSWDPYVDILSKPDTLLPEIDLLYISGDLFIDSPSAPDEYPIFYLSYIKNKTKKWPPTFEEAHEELEDIYGF